MNAKTKTKIIGKLEIKKKYILMLKVTKMNM